MQQKAEKKQHPDQSGGMVLNDCGSQCTGYVLAICIGIPISAVSAEVLLLCDYVCPDSLNDNVPLSFWH